MELVTRSNDCPLHTKGPTMVTIELTEDQANRLRDDLRARGAFIRPGSVAHVIVTQIDAQVAKQLPRCVYCGRRDWGTVESLAQHMVADHRCSDDRYGEDTAWTDAWKAFQDAGFDPKPFV